LTYSDKDWDEHAHYSPDGKQIAWMSSRGFTIDYGTKGDERLAWNVDMSDAEARLKTELWVINTDGSNPKAIKAF